MLLRCHCDSSSSIFVITNSVRPVDIFDSGLRLRNRRNELGQRSCGFYQMMQTTIVMGGITMMCSRSHSLVRLCLCVSPLFNRLQHVQTCSTSMAKCKPAYPQLNECPSLNNPEKDTDEGKRRRNFRRIQATSACAPTPI